jgi:hypothetical protein
MMNLEARVREVCLKWDQCKCAADITDEYVIMYDELMKDFKREFGLYPNIDWLEDDDETRHD